MKHLTACVAVLALSVAQSAGAQQAVPDPVLPRIVNGIDSYDYPTTGQLLYAGNTTIDSNNAGAWCSGTLIGCQTFLVAAHCVDGDMSPGHYEVYLQHAGLQAVSSISKHPSSTSQNFPIADVAVLKLAAPVTGITPQPINTSANPADIGFGLTGTIVGFGQTSGSAGDYGIKRAGAVSTVTCSSSPSGTSDTELVCWNFSNPIGAPGEDSNTCNGDSGGPLFMDLGAGQVVAGVTSGGSSAACLPTDHSYDANVYTYRSFILAQLGADSTAACGGLDPVGSATVQVVGNGGSLSLAHTSETFTVSVGTGVNDLRFALNAEDNGSFNANFYVKQGPGVTTSDFDCKADGGSNFGDCEFGNPASGQWSVLITRAAGSGQYQFTSTIFGGDAPICGNDLKELGEACDGADNSACPGACLGDCTCPPPVCGNDTVESGEECDGADAAACPTGVCGVDCTCPAPVCGNDVTENGESCDGSDDSSCPGLCGLDCACPQSCFNDLFTRMVRSSSRRFLYSGLIDTFFNASYDGLDPRNQFSLLVTQGGGTVLATIPASDPGWERSRPSKGRYKWKGSIGGITSIKAVEKLNRWLWQVRVKGKAVPGADQIDEFATMDIRLSMDGICTLDSY